MILSVLDARKKVVLMRARTRCAMRDLKGGSSRVTPALAQASGHHASSCGLISVDSYHGWRGKNAT